MGSEEAIGIYKTTCEPATMERHMTGDATFLNNWVRWHLASTVKVGRDKTQPSFSSILPVLNRCS